MFWGKLKHKTLVELFGDVQQIPHSVPLQSPPAPGRPAITKEVAVTSLDQPIHAEVGLPIIDFDALVAKLPAIAPRAWTPAHPGAAGQAVSYLVLAEVDVTESLDLVERVCALPRT